MRSKRHSALLTLILRMRLFLFAVNRSFVHLKRIYPQAIRTGCAPQGTTGCVVGPVGGESVVSGIRLWEATS